MSIAARALERSLEAARARREEEMRSLLEAGLRVVRRQGVADTTVAEVLAEAKLSSRAFYRYFRSKEELVLAVFERESQEAGRRMGESLEGVSGPRAKLEAWLDEVLALGYDARRVRSTRVLAPAGAHLRAAHPAEFQAMNAAVVQPLVEVLESGRGAGAFPGAHPEADARTIHAMAWSLVEAKLAGAGFETAAEARAHVLRFCLPALGASA